MRTSDLLLSKLDINEYNYSYSGQFYLSSEGAHIQVDISDIQSDPIINSIKKVFSLKDDITQIRNTLMDMLVEAARVGSRITEGENYEKKALRAY